MSEYDMGMLGQIRARRKEIAVTLAVLAVEADELDVAIRVAERMTAPRITLVRRRHTAATYTPGKPKHNRSGFRCEKCAGPRSDGSARMCALCYQRFNPERAVKAAQVRQL